VAVAGQIMVDVQKLLMDIGCTDVRTALRIQNEIPEQLKKKFELTIGGSDDYGMGTGPSEGNDDAMESAMTSLCETLDFLGKGAVGSWMTDRFEDEDSRCLIAQDLIDLNDHLQGYILEYGTPDDVKTFRNLDRERILAYTMKDDEVSGAIGVVQKDGSRKNRWYLTNDRYLVPLGFSRNIDPSDIPTFAEAGPVILTGHVKRNAEGHIASIDRVTGCYYLSDLKFFKIITKDGDRELLNPLIGKAGYNAQTDIWSLRNDQLGINVKKSSWDECMVAFHEYALFLFQRYADTDQTFEGEEQDIREFLLSLLPVI